MSAFLGPIHHWLYFKILWHETLLNDIISTLNLTPAEKENLTSQLSERFGSPEVRPLEEVIDITNIHGWLQLKIESLEKRTAYVIQTALDEKWASIEQFIKLYEDNGLKAYRNYPKVLQSPDELFKALNDYLLDGMPCDRINNILSSDEDALVWEKRACIHTPHWDAVHADIKWFNTLRIQWIKSFSSESFTFNILNENTYEITRGA